MTYTFHLSLSVFCSETSLTVSISPWNLWRTHVAPQSVIILSLSLSSRSFGRRRTSPSAYPVKEIWDRCFSLFFSIWLGGGLGSLRENEKTCHFPTALVRLCCCVLICIMWLPSASTLSSYCCYILTYSVVLHSRWRILQPCQHDVSVYIWIIKYNMCFWSFLTVLLSCLLYICVGRLMIIM